MSTPAIPGAAADGLARAQRALRLAVDAAQAGDSRALRRYILEGEAALGALRHLVDRTSTPGSAT